MKKTKGEAKKMIQGEERKFKKGQIILKEKSFELAIYDVMLGRVGVYMNYGTHLSGNFRCSFSDHDCFMPGHRASSHLKLIVWVSASSSRSPLSSMVM